MDKSGIDVLVMPSIDYLKLADEIKRDLRRVVFYFVDALRAEGRKISDPTRLSRTEIMKALPDMYVDPMFAIRHLFAAGVLRSSDTKAHADSSCVRLTQEFLVENYQMLDSYHSRRTPEPNRDPATT